ncbi:MAG TPA: sigma-54-dependent Fis family transcriptional regulator [Chthoniobacterales bacterium]
MLILPGQKSPDTRAYLKERRFLEMPSGVVRDEIQSSWQRCLNTGLDPADAPHPEVISQRELREHQEQNARLHEIVQAEVRNLYSQIAGSNFMVAFANHDTLILDAIMDDSFRSLARAGGILPGVSWDENVRGTNGLGSCVATRLPFVVHGTEHFFQASCRFTCIAHPVFDHEDRLLGVIDASSDCRARQVHTMALMRMAALQIEAEYFRETFRQNIILQFHNRTEFVHTLEAGLLALDRDGRIVASNRQARFFLNGLPVKPGRSFETIFDVSFDRFFHQTAASGSTELTDDRGSTFKVLALNLRRRTSIPAGIARTPAPPKQATFVCKDLSIQNAIRLIENAVAWKVPILIRGETGSGKELMARHAHQTSKCPGKFVAVNCTALPETLVESEFFGYREGAFTGSRRGGAQGLIRDADKGTLFLDEIGDMPVPLQGRLLRFLDQWTVRAVGSSEETEVDVQVIAATNSPLEKAVTEGKFRADLLYRLQGIEVTIPPLRERTDFDEIVQSILTSIAPGGSISADALDLLRRHTWPGNFRELKNALLRMVISSDSAFLERSNVASFLGPCPASPVSATLAPPIAAPTLLRDNRSRIIVDAYHRCDGNIVKTALELAVSRNTIYRELKKQGLL